MSFNLNPKSETIQDLPEELREVLCRFAETQSDADLTELIVAVLKDLGTEMDGFEMTDDTNFIVDLGLDSLAITEFIFFFEDVFEFRITNEDLAQMKTLGVLKTYLRQKLVQET